MMMMMMMMIKSVLSLSVIGVASALTQGGPRDKSRTTETSTKRVAIHNPYKGHEEEGNTIINKILLFLQKKFPRECYDLSPRISTDMSSAPVLEGLNEARRRSIPTPTATAVDARAQKRRRTSRYVVQRRTSRLPPVPIQSRCHKKSKVIVKPPWGTHRTMLHTGNPTDCTTQRRLNTNFFNFQTGGGRKGRDVSEQNSLYRYPYPGNV